MSLILSTENKLDRDRAGLGPKLDFLFQAGIDNEINYHKALVPSMYMAAERKSVLTGLINKIINIGWIDRKAELRRFLGVSQGLAVMA